jgi:hypothetical protein
MELFSGSSDCLDIKGEDACDLCLSLPADCKLQEGRNLISLVTLLTSASVVIPGTQMEHNKCSEGKGEGGRGQTFWINSKDINHDTTWPKRSSPLSKILSSTL